MNLDNLFKNCCKKNNLEINSYQLSIIDELKSYYNLNFNKSILNKFFSKNSSKPAFYLYVVEKKNGNIIRISDLYLDYKSKKRKNVKPIGFAIGNTKLYLTNTDGKMMVVDLNLGKVIGVEKVAGNFISRPFIFNQSLFVIRNGSIVQYN